MSVEPTAEQAHTTGTSDTSAGLGRRERKKLRTRQAIRSNALRLFAEHGFDHTTLEDITEAADVAPRTFFLHFASKEDVLLGNAQEQAEVFHRLLAARPADEFPLTAVREAVLGLVRAPGQDHEELMLSARLMEKAPSLMARNLEHYTTSEAVITAEVARRCGQDPHTDVYPGLLSACAMTALRVAFTIWYRRGGDGSLEEPVRDAFDRLAVGLVAPASAPRQG